MMLKEMLPPSTRRVELHTKKDVNEKIEKNTIENIDSYKNADHVTLTERLKELNREWDTERVLEANAAIIILVSSILGFLFSRYWFIFTGIISFFLLQHALQGWCPPLPIIRRLGIRTPEEIKDEKTAIKLLRGDFTGFNKNSIDIIKIMKTD